ncbi:MAG: type IIL restriction-modification enzyme MmeI, partial [Candidatus Brocadiia bacterium]
LGDKLMRGALGDDYVDKLRALYEGRIPGQSDLCCYWFEKARAQIAGGQCDRAGLLATQGIRGEANRQVLRRIKETGEIFFAVSDRAWILDGAAVHVAMVGFDDGQQERRTLDGKRVQEIHSNLAGYEIDITEATKLPDHGDLGFIGTTKKAPLDIDEELAIGMLGCPNPSGLPNSDVILPYLNGRDVLQVNQRRFIIDFPPRMSFTQAAQYEAPFEYVKREVLPQRRNHRERVQREYWWRLARPCPDLMEAMSNAERVCVTPVVSKHRVFVWLSPPVNPDHKLLVLPYAGDYLFGLLQSAVHETWARAQGTQVRDRGSGFQYTPTTCFQTFPFPWPPGQEPDDSPLVEAVADAARELNELRENWLNPPDWTTTEVLEFPGSVDGPWARYVHDPNEDGIGTVRYPRVVDNGKMPSQLKRRTLTNLYNERPTWLENAHRALDEAVFAAYSAATGDPAWTPEMTDEDILEQLLSLNLQRAEQTR